MTSVAYSHRIFALQARGGISRYSCELARHVHGIDGLTCRIVAPLHFNEALRECDAPKLAHFIGLRGRTARLYQAANRMLAPALTRSVRPQILHHTYFAPEDFEPTLNNVVTVHDMIHELFSSEFAASDPTSRKKRLCVERADHVLCVSQNTAADLVRLFGVAPEKVSVTHLGVSEVFSQPRPEDETSPHGRPYLLYVGHRSGYKNFAAAVRAYATSPHLHRDFDLVVFGGFALKRSEQADFEALGLRANAVVQYGGDDAALARAYRHARALVYPSLYEGFGIPPLEAMSAGCAVVCSNRSSIPEVVGEAALMFDPADPDAVREAMERVSFDDGTHAELVAAGQRRATDFSWVRCAERTATIYQRLIGGGRTHGQPARPEQHA